MATAQQIHIKNNLLIGSKCLGNSNRGLKEVCSDLLNQYGKGKSQMRALIDGTFLCRSTIERMMELSETDEGMPYRPNADTCERILKFFQAEIHFDQVQINRRYINKEKANH